MQTSTRQFIQPGWLLAVALSAGGVVALMTESGPTSASPRAAEAPAAAVDTAQDDPHAGLDEVVSTGSAECPGSKPSGHPGGHGSAAMSAMKPGEIARATGPGAHTVAEILDGAPGLAGAQVRVAARVIKVATGVLGRNWLHVQDGSGSAAAGNHDLIVTTTASVSVGDEVIVEGRVTRDKDLGSGYRYDTLVEDAGVTARERTATR